MHTTRLPSSRHWSEWRQKKCCLGLAKGFWESFFMRNIISEEKGSLRISPSVHWWFPCVWRDSEQEADDKNDASPCKEPSSPLMTVLQLRLNVGTKEWGFHLFSSSTVWMHLSTLWYGDILIPFMSIQSVWAFFLFPFFTVSSLFVCVARGLYDSMKSMAFPLWVVDTQTGDSFSFFVFWEESIRTHHSVASRLHIDICFHICLD